MRSLRSLRGQMNSPFELLVTMVILVFVMILGSQMLAYVNQVVCEQGVNFEVSEFITSLESTAGGKASKEFSFYPTNVCFNPDNAVIKLQRISQQLQCSAVCGIPEDDCWVFIFNSQKQTNNIFIQRCIGIHPYTSFIIDSSNCNTEGKDELRGFDALDPRIEMPLGKYVLRNVSSIGDSLPKICTYYKSA